MSDNNLEQRARELNAHPLGHQATWQLDDTLICDCGRIFKETDEHGWHVLEVSIAILTRVQAEARLEEAKLWAHNWYGFDNLGLSGKVLQAHSENCRDCQRITALAQAAAPAKETQP